MSETATSHTDERRAAEEGVPGEGAVSPDPADDTDSEGPRAGTVSGAIELTTPAAMARDTPTLPRTRHTLITPRVAVPPAVAKY